MISLCFPIISPSIAPLHPDNSFSGHTNPGPHVQLEYPLKLKQTLFLSHFTEAPVWKTITNHEKQTYPTKKKRGASTKEQALSYAKRRTSAFYRPLEWRRWPFAFWTKGFPIPGEAACSGERFHTYIRGPELPRHSSNYTTIVSGFRPRYFCLLHTAREKCVFRTPEQMRHYARAE